MNKTVHDEGSRRAFEFYRDLIESKGYEPINQTLVENGDPTDPSHLLWMCNECIPQARYNGQGMMVAKYSRWLGYIQGCLISKGWTTVENERNRTRNWFN